MFYLIERKNHDDWKAVGLVECHQEKWRKTLKVPDPILTTVRSETEQGHTNGHAQLDGDEYRWRPSLAG